MSEKWLSLKKIVEKTPWNGKSVKKSLQMKKYREKTINLGKWRGKPFNKKTIHWKISENISLMLIMWKNN